MFDNSGLVKLRSVGAVMYCWIKNATRRKKEPCPKCQKRKVQKMLSLQPSAMDRLNYELCVQRDRLVRLQSVQNDLALDLPHSIPLPDGEEIPYGSSIRLQIRDPQQESEIYQQCIRPPPNRTISKGDTPPPYRHLLTASRGSGGRSNKKSGDLFGRTVGCFGMRKNEEPPPLPPPPPPPCVYVPIHPRNRARQIAAFAEKGSKDITSVPTVQCTVPARNIAANRPGQAIPEAPSGDKIASHSSTATAAAGTSASAPQDYLDTKGPEIRSSRGTSGATSAYYPSDYLDTKGPERRYSRGPAAAPTASTSTAAAAAAASAASTASTSAGEKKPEKGSV